MMKPRSLPGWIASTLVSASLSGCTGAGAPSFVAFGAFFPAWMLCGFVGLAGAIVARGVLVGTAFGRALPYKLLVCTAIGIIAAVLVWLLCFGW
jgi:hypothetical protein